MKAPNLLVQHPFCNFPKPGACLVHPEKIYHCFQQVLNLSDLVTKAKRQHQVGVYLRGKPRIYWLRE